MFRPIVRSVFLLRWRQKRIVFERIFPIELKLLSAALEMKSEAIHFLLVSTLVLIYSADQIQIGMIPKSSLTVLGLASMWINGTCQECLCQIISHSYNASSYNCFNNNTCEIIAIPFNSMVIHLKNDSNSVFYFFASTIQLLNSTTITSISNTDVTTSE